MNNVTNCQCATAIKKDRLEELASFAKDSSNVTIFLYNKELRLDILIDSMEMNGTCKETIEEVRNNSILIHKLSKIDVLEGHKFIDKTFDTIAKCFSEAAAGAVGGSIAQTATVCKNEKQSKDNGGFLLVGSGEQSRLTGKVGESCG